MLTSIDYKTMGSQWMKKPSPRDGGVAPSDKYGDHNTTLQTVQQPLMHYLQLGLESFRFVLF